MTAAPPDLSTQESLASHFVRPSELDWTPTRFPGITVKVLMRDDLRGLMTALLRWEAGARLPDHVHQDIEQSYVLEGSLADAEGEARAGDFVWRPAGSRHEAWSPAGALMLAVFLRPNRFVGDEERGGTA